MEKTYTITLSDFDLGQAMDGLEVRAAAWEDTARYLRTGESPDALFITEECRDAEEAEKIAGHYRRVIESIARQIAAQRGA